MSKKVKSQNCSRSECPLSCTLDLLGDKWSLLIIRDMIFGKCKYKEFETSPEGIPTNILAARLKKLVADGIIAKKAYQTNPQRYAYFLTEKGTTLLPVLQALVEWGMAYNIGGLQPPRRFFKMTPKQLLNIVEERQQSISL